MAEEWVEEKWNGSEGSRHNMKTKVGGGGRGWGTVRGVGCGVEGRCARSFFGETIIDVVGRVLLVGLFPDRRDAVQVHGTSCAAPVRRRVADGQLNSADRFAKANVCSDLIIPQFLLTRAKLC